MDYCINGSSREILIGHLNHFQKETSKYADLSLFLLKIRIFG